MDQVGSDYLSLCAGDTACASHFENYNPKAVLAKLVNSPNAFDRCPAFAELQEYIPMILAQVLQMHQIRPFLAPLIYRMNRCSPNDAVAINNFLSLIFGFGGQAPTTRSLYDMNTILYTNIASTELSHQPFKQNDYPDLLFGTGQNSSDLFTMWDKYPTDEHFNSFPTTDSRVLLLNGDLDPQTPFLYADGQYQGINAPWKRLVKFPGNMLDQSSIFESTI